MEIDTRIENFVNYKTILPCKRIWFNYYPHIGQMTFQYDGVFIFINSLEPEIWP